MAERTSQVFKPPSCRHLFLAHNTLQGGDNLLPTIKPWLAGDVYIHIYTHDQSSFETLFLPGWSDEGTLSLKSVGRTVGIGVSLYVIDSHVPNTNSRQ